MNRLLENGQLTELNCGTNFSYILNDGNLFFSTEYKVMQNQAKSCFLKCMKMLYNGKLQLFYLTSSLRPFSVLIPSLDPDSLLTIVANIFGSIIDVKNNGFLSCQNIEVSFDKIFVDPSTHKVNLVYIPTSVRIHSDEAIFENEIRTNLVRLITGVSTLSSPKTIQLVSDLSNGLLTIEDIFAHLKGGVIQKEQKATVATTAKIVAMNTENRVEVVITKGSFVLGKNAGMVDGVISINKMISRVHCKIENNGGQYTVTDLQSANGTYVNRIRLQPNRPTPIKNGDVIRLANSDFQFVVK